jgi:hypothetical protein
MNGLVAQGTNYEHLRFVGSDGRILFHCVPRWQALQVQERRDRLTRKAMGIPQAESACRAGDLWNNIWRAYAVRAGLEDFLSQP